MKFNCDYFTDVLDVWHANLLEKRKLKRKKLVEWHKHFAWWPVKIAPKDCRWLETVEQRIAFKAMDSQTLKRRYIDFGMFSGQDVYERKYWEYRSLKE